MNVSRLLAAAVPLLMLAACEDSTHPCQLDDCTTHGTTPTINAATLAQTCASCHGAGFRGNPSAPTPTPNLSVVQSYTTQQFDVLLAAGVKADGAAGNPRMLESTRTFGPAERTALYEYLRAYTTNEF